MEQRFKDIIQANIDAFTTPQDNVRIEKDRLGNPYKIKFEFDNYVGIDIEDSCDYPTIYCNSIKTQWLTTSEFIEFANLCSLAAKIAKNIEREIEMEKDLDNPKPEQSVPRIPHKEDREGWLLSDLSSVTRSSIPVEQYNELKALANKMRVKLNEISKLVK